MGIPNFFSYIIHNHAGVLCRYFNIFQQNIQFHRLYMDCNSILYDCYRKIPNTKPLLEIEDLLLDATCKQIEMYISQVNPTETVYIAFDGVAPVAKMEQQRTRRYKSWFETAITNKIENKEAPDPKKTTSMFTPGTAFMNKLSKHMRNHFEKKEKKYRVKQIIVATPDEAGEGEHKLFQHMRVYPSDGPCAVYGLDADLMMLGLFHLSFCPNMYIFRESPQFAQNLLKKTKNDTLHKDEPLFIDIAKLGRSIANEMRCNAPDTHRMYDYVFMCFFLGNDFLPHFPSLNIRTGGISALMDTYRMVIGNTKGRYLLSKTNPPEIQWKEVSRLISSLAKHEYTFLTQEYATRKRWDNKTAEMMPKNTEKERFDLFQNTPVLYRKEERYINPYETEWEERYYNILFPKNESTKDICVNYLEGLEWVYNYYIQGKVNWAWKYNYNYPPLLKDLAPTVPHNATTFLPQKHTEPINPIAQLAYVLPPVYHHLLPDDFVKNYTEYYDGYELNEDGLPNLQFQWAFCRYFWESHVHLPDIPEMIVQKWNESLIEMSMV